MGKEMIPLHKGPLNNLHIISDIESSYQYGKTVAWYETYQHFSVIASVLYLTLLYFGKRWMEKKERFKLQRLLFMWNTGLAAFSVFGMLSLTPSLLQVLRHRGYQYSVCEFNVYKDPQLALWSVLFVFSKLIELGDTAFVVLRKSPLQFLHWYHHITVLYLTWYHVPSGMVGLSHWGSVMNFFVHSIMYSYYALRAAGVKVPNNIAMTITLLQITQMLIGLAVHLTAYYLISQGRDCMTNNIPILFFGLAIYASYAILFIMFFINRFFSKRKVHVD